MCVDGLISCYVVGCSKLYGKVKWIGIRGKEVHPAALVRQASWLLCWALCGGSMAAAAKRNK